MDLSALIFVALAVAWAVYLIPKALKHHDEVVRSRSIERFSESMRILARREPVDARNARLVVTPLRSPAPPRVETKARASTAPAAQPGPASAPPRVVTRASAARAARRRRNVLALILLANAVVVALASFAVVAWPWVAAPAGLLVAWLVACRLSVKSERRARARTSPPLPLVTGAIEAGDPASTGSMPPVVAPRAPAPRAPAPAPVVPVGSPVTEAPAILTGEIPIVSSDPGAWDMVPTVLPTYVAKPAAARRTVSTIDLDSTGVWSSGRNDDDSALARSAEAASTKARQADEQGVDPVGEKRASGA